MGVTVLDPVDKSPNDKREYRAIQLENGLRILLISDCDNGNVHERGDVNINKSEKLSAAALCVGVGSFLDPPDIPGMAHFLEHMVFMGSKKYPDENDFDAFTKKYGGGSNAFTDCERTVFIFDVKMNHMYEALDRFAQFFISPLMKKDSVDREVEAVDSEFEMALQSDSNRKEQLLAHIARNGHPMNKFMWGNRVSIKETPELAGINLYVRLQEFHKTYYSSHYMTLAIQSRHNLDTLQEWASEIFSGVSKNTLPQPVFDKLEAPYKTPAFFKLYKAVPVKKVHQVDLTWSLPCLQKEYRKKPLHYLGWLVGHEGAGSILSYLRKKVWALSLCGGNSDSGFEHNTSGALFSISATLTEQGMDFVYEVITVILQYLDMLRRVGPQKRIYDEIRTIEANDFAWQEKLESYDTVEKLAENVQLYPAADCLTGESLMWDYDEQLITACQNQIVPGAASLLLYSKRFGEDGVCDQTEPWFNIPYSVSDVPQHWLDSWKDMKPNPDLHMPAENTYIASDFSLKESDRELTLFPVKLTDTPSHKLWYKKDTKFNAPKAYVNFKLINPMVSESAVNAATFDLYVRTLEHNLTEVTYAANCAQLTYQLSTDSTGLRLKFSGFNHKLRNLFCKVVDYVADFVCQEDVFEALVDQLKRIYYNKYIKPEKMSVELRLSALLEPYWSTVEKSQALAEVTREKLLEFGERIRSEAVVEGLVQGNMTSEEALEMEQYLLGALKCQPLGQPITLPRCRGVPPGEMYCRVANFNKADNNSVITNYYQHGPTDIHGYCIYELITTHMEQPVYAVLRSREQLGYSVYCTCRVTDGILALSITICSQANKFKMVELDEKIEKFLVEFGGMLKSMTEDDFQTLVMSMVTLKCCEDTQLLEEVERNWGEICSQEYVFDRLTKQVDALRKMTHAEMLAWFNDHVSSGGKHKKLSVQIVGNADAADRKQKLRNCEDHDDGDGTEDMDTEKVKEEDDEDDDDDQWEDVSDEDDGEGDNDVDFSYDAEDDGDDESSSEDDDDEDESDDSEIPMEDGALEEWKFLACEEGLTDIKDLKHVRETLQLYPVSKIL